jgi:hypothetical protein
MKRAECQVTVDRDKVKNMKKKASGLFFALCSLHFASAAHAQQPAS